MLAWVVLAAWARAVLTKLNEGQDSMNRENSDAGKPHSWSCFALFLAQKVKTRDRSIDQITFPKRFGWATEVQLISVKFDQTY